MRNRDVKHYKVTNITAMSVTIEDIGLTFRPGEFNIVNASAVDKSSDLQRYRSWVKVEPVVIPQKGPPNPIRLVRPVDAPGVPKPVSEPSPAVPPVPPPVPPEVQRSVDDLTRKLDDANQQHQADMTMIKSLLSQIIAGGVRTSASVSDRASDSDSPIPIVLPGNIVPKSESVKAHVKTEEGEVDADGFDAKREALKKNRSRKAKR